MDEFFVLVGDFTYTAPTTRLYRTEQEARHNADRWDKEKCIRRYTCFRFYSNSSIGDEIWSKKKTLDK